ncbi:hypothetical protein E9O_07763 [Moraxella catarrhalis 12P80B1]|nr:hypothetical protein E9O_07763 [Moraxella catarrhalis 12P80B1]
MVIGKLIKKKQSIEENPSLKRRLQLMRQKRQAKAAQIKDNLSE